METPALASPISWVGGKHVAARRIIAAFPPIQSYGTYVDVFGGAAHVLVAKPPCHHLEVYNDVHGDLVNFWMMARDQPEALQARLETLPFSRHLHALYRSSLQEETVLDDLERAARWFYVMRSTFGGGPDFSKGWGYSVQEGNHRARTLRSATALLTAMAARFRLVQIECQDFAALIPTYQTRRTLLYCDPPYIGCEDYYNVGETPVFTTDDHARLAELLNETPALVALSYYEHPLLEELYPAPKWRRMTWTQTKAIERTRATRQYAHEVLLMNYSATQGQLWPLDDKEPVHDDE